MTYIQFKKSVEIHPLALDPEMIRGLRVAAALAPPLVDNIMVVTSQYDGTHREDSLHYVGRAWDLRFKGRRTGGVMGEGGTIGTVALERWVKQMHQVLGPDWQILLEANHIHMELDPNASRQR